MSKTAIKALKESVIGAALDVLLEMPEEYQHHKYAVDRHSLPPVQAGIQIPPPAKLILAPIKVTTITPIRIRSIWFVLFIESL